MKRKLTTVFCADVQNYGKMMARDEAETLERLKRYRGIMDGLFERHEGRKVNTWGDAVIAEFGSVVEAVRCAVAIQDAIGAENRDLGADRQMWFRVGINLGDVMEEGGDIYGDGVNLAARLQTIAEPGGIMVSESVHDLAHKQLTVAFDFAGKRSIKSGEEPIPAYRVRVGGANRPEAYAASDVPPGLAVELPGPPPSPDSIFRKAEERFEQFRDWFGLQKRTVQISVAMIGFFLAINVFFSGISTPWFIFPSLPFALYILIATRKSRGT